MLHEQIAMASSKIVAADRRTFAFLELAQRAERVCEAFLR